MAWDVNQIYVLTQFLVNKNQSNYVSPTNLFYAWNTEQRAFQSDLLGRFQAISNGKSGANTGLIENETILTKLTPFTKNVSISVSGGQATKPSDFIYGLATRINGKKVTIINKGQIASVTDSVIDPPSEIADSYYATESLNYYDILPDTVTNLEVDYISDVTDIVWGFTVVGGRNVYNSATSVQPQWSTPDIIEITKRTLKVLGVYFSSQDFENYGNSVINTGN